MTETSVGAALAGPVHLTIPAASSMARLVRLTASALASLGGATLDEIDDIKLAVSELLVVLLEHGKGSSIDLQFEVVDARTSLGADDTGQLLVMQGTAPVDTLAAGHADLVLCRMVLESVCATCDLRVVEGSALIVAAVRLGQVE